MSAPPSFLGQVFTRKLVAFAGGTLLIYDYLLTLSLEVMHIWNEPWSLVKLLFLVNRYGNLIGQTFIMLEETGYLSHGSRSFCLGFQLFAPLFSAFSGESIRLFVVMRTCAVLGYKRRVAWVVNTLYGIYGMIIVIFFTFLLLSDNDRIQFEFLDETGLCIIPFGLHPTLWLMWFIPLVLDSCMMGIICYSFWRTTKDTPGISPSPLLRLLLRDGFFFYIAASFNVVLAMICWTVYSPDPRNYLQTLISYPFLSAVGQRLVLNLRDHRSPLHSTLDATQQISRPVAAASEVERSDSGSDLGFEMVNFRKGRVLK